MVAVAQRRVEQWAVSVREHEVVGVLVAGIGFLWAYPADAPEPAAGSERGLSEISRTGRALIFAGGKYCGWGLVGRSSLRRWHGKRRGREVGEDGQV